MRVAAQRDQRVAERFGKPQLLDDLHRLDALLDGAGAQAACQPGDRIGEQLEHRLAGLAARLVLHLVEPLPELLETNLADRSADDPAH